MPFRPKRALSTGAKTYQATSFLSPKASIPISVAAGVFDGFMGPDTDLDIEPFLKSHERYKKDVMDATRVASRELGSQMGARMSARGVNNSAVGDFIVGANKARLQKDAIRQIAQNKADLEHRLAIAQARRNAATTASEQATYDQTINDIQGQLIQIGQRPTGEADARSNWLKEKLAEYFGEPEPERHPGYGGHAEYEERPEPTPVAQTQNTFDDIDRTLGTLGSPVPEISANTPSQKTQLNRIKLEEQYGTEMIAYLDDVIGMDRLLAILQG